MAMIEGLGVIAKPSRKSVRAAPAGAGFRVPDEPQAAGVSTTYAAAELSLGGLLALQEGEPGPGHATAVQDRAARRHGRDLLAALAALQRGLLGGALGTGDVRRLADLAEDIPPAADPRLRHVMQAIALRAKVELALLGQGAA